MRAIIFYSIYALLIGFNILLIVRTKRVFRFKTSLLNIVDLHAGYDIRSGKEWIWRFDMLDTVSFQTMVWKFWKPLKAENFYKDTAFIGVPKTTNLLDYKEHQPSSRTTFTLVQPKAKSGYKLDFADRLNIESDRRKLRVLVERGVVTEEELNTAPVYIIEPNCNCGEGLRPVGSDLRCPRCNTKGTKTLY